LRKCALGESNLHELIKLTRPSTLRVYQFRHRRLRGNDSRGLASVRGRGYSTNMCSLERGDKELTPWT
jgi:hypothetical protein